MTATIDSCGVCHRDYDTTDERLAEGVYWCSRPCRAVYRRMNAARAAVSVATTPDEKRDAAERLRLAWDEMQRLRARSA